MNEIQMQLEQGMLINGGFLTEKEARTFLIEVLKQDKNGLKREKFKSEVDHLIRLLKRLRNKTNGKEISSIRAAYVA